MSYEKLGFVSGQTLKAEHLNHMEEGIANAGGVTSWNDLQDKPFGEEPRMEIMSEIKFTDIGDGYHQILYTPTHEIVAGKTYEVILSGTSYFSEAMAVNTDGIEVVLFGNTADLSGVDNGCPLMCIYSATGEDGVSEPVIMITDSGSSNVSNNDTCSIYTTETIKTINEKYLPLLISPSGKKFKLTIDDNGTISATEITT